MLSMFADPQPYKRPWFYINHQIETMVPALVRKVTGVFFQRERITTPDQDYLDLDWLPSDSKKLVIISHGLEGSTDRPYVQGMAKRFNTDGYSVLAWNFRGCSGEMNLLPRMYHSGVSDDLEVVINHAIAKGFTSVSLIGFSLGGNVTLKYLGEKGKDIPSQVESAVAFSVPSDLAGGAVELGKFKNKHYSLRFLRNLKRKAILKNLQFPGIIDVTQLNTMNTLKEFDNAVTAPLHGFKNADDYYSKCSSLPLLSKIKIPTLVVNARNDSFLSAKSFPSKEDINNTSVLLEYPSHGGHCGFTSFSNEFFWSENRAFNFISRIGQSA